MSCRRCCHNQPVATTRSTLQLSWLGSAEFPKKRDSGPIQKRNTPPCLGKEGAPAVCGRYRFPESQPQGFGDKSPNKGPSPEDLIQSKRLFGAPRSPRDEGALWCSGVAPPCCCNHCRGLDRSVNPAPLYNICFSSRGQEGKRNKHVLIIDPMGVLSI